MTPRLSQNILHVLYICSIVVLKFHSAEDHVLDKSILELNI